MAQNGNNPPIKTQRSLIQTMRVPSGIFSTRFARYDQRKLSFAAACGGRMDSGTWRRADKAESCLLRFSSSASAAWAPLRNSVCQSMGGTAVGAVAAGSLDIFAGGKGRGSLFVSDCRLTAAWRTDDGWICRGGSMKKTLRGCWLTALARRCCASSEEARMAIRPACPKQTAINATDRSCQPVVTVLCTY